MQLFIGAGGWEYFQCVGDKLAAYARVYNFVEVNSTFYSNPGFKTVGSWRKRVPDEFEFAVKCNKNITHKHLLIPTAESIAQAEYTSRICQLLRSKLLILQTPPALNITAERINSFAELLDIFRGRGVMTFIEARSGIQKDALEAMDQLGIGLSVDLTLHEPTKANDIIYSRLFGSQKSRSEGFSEEEYVLIEKKIRSVEPKTVYLAFHGIQMYSDALQFRKRLSQKGP